MTASNIVWYLFVTVAVFFGMRSFERFSKRLERIVVEVEKRDQQQESEDDIIYFQLPEPAENGWDNIEVNKNKRRCERVHCFGGPPTYFEVVDYDLRPKDHPRTVFARLVDMWEEDLSADLYQVINGVICAKASERTPSDDLENRIVWHELVGPERYVILSAHGIGKEFFVREQARIQKALKQLTARAEALGAVKVERHGWIRYEPSPNTDEEQKSAIKAGITTLCSEENLSQLHVSFREVFQQDCAFVLNKFIGESLEQSV